VQRVVVSVTRTLRVSVICGTVGRPELPPTLIARMPSSCALCYGGTIGGFYYPKHCQPHNPDRAQDASRWLAPAPGPHTPNSHPWFFCCLFSLTTSQSLKSRRLCVLPLTVLLSLYDLQMTLCSGQMPSRNRHGLPQSIRSWLTKELFRPRRNREHKR
jgi:hypothetical protein